MAAFNTIITRTGCVEEMKLRLSSNATWTIPVADTEVAALELATEKFNADALRSEWEIATDTVEAYEIHGKNGIIGWDIEADGWPLDRD